MPYKDKEVNRKYQREWQAKKREFAIANGLCPNCKKRKPFSEWGTKQCKECLLIKYKDRVKNRERDRKSNRKLKAKWKQEGKCPRCGRPKWGYEETVYCIACSTRK